MTKMTREEAVDFLWEIIGELGYVECLSNEQKAKMDRAYEVLLPEPDPETRLVPCGCGGALVLCQTEQPEFSTFMAPMYSVRCDGAECLFFMGYYDKAEEAIEAANIVMGWRASE